MKKNRGTGLVPVKSTGTGPEPVPARIPPEPEFRSGPSANKAHSVYLCSVDNQYFKYVWDGRLAVLLFVVTLFVPP